jgi:DNA-binding NtrC family response regulator
LAGERVLIVEDRAATRDMLREALEEAGYRVCEAANLFEADEKLRSMEFEIVVSDLCLPRGSGLDVLERVQKGGDMTPVILLTAYGSIESAVQAMKRGAFEFLTKPFEMDHLLLVLKRALEQCRLERHTMALRSEEEGRLGQPAIVGESPAFRRAYQAAMRVASSETSVLLLGESGTGKDLFARALHQMSPRAGAPWVAINCAALPRELVESELFGAERGAYTGSHRRRLGKVELANGGTLFLDEVAELDFDSQAKLLRVIEERCFERLGGARTVHVDIRLVTATNRDLHAAVAAGRFREDLYYRLQVFPIRVPSLREREGDIPLLVQHFLEKFSAEMKRKTPRLTPGTMQMLANARWPGNVRQLRNAIERALILCEGETIEERHFDLESAPAGVTSPAAEGEVSIPRLKDVAREATTEAETRIIRRALEATGGNRTRAAEMLGISVKTLWTKVRDYHLVPGGS